MMMTPQERLEIARRIYELAKRIEHRAIVRVNYAWIIEDARELAIIGFDLISEAKEHLPKQALGADRLL